MKIVFFETSESEQKKLKEKLSSHELLFFMGKLNMENVMEARDCEVVSTFINSPITEEILRNLPNLKLIVTRSTGYDHIDKEACAKRGIVVTNVPAYGARTVAEFAFALMLCVSRKIVDASVRVKATDGMVFDGLMGFDLFGKTLGVIGTGKIGKNVVNIALGFGMNVLMYDMYPDEKFAIEKSVKYVSLDELYASSDIISLHTPYTPESKHMVNKESILKMKKGMVIINTARGELVDTDALVWGIKEKHIFGAGLDVLEDEKELKDGTYITEHTKTLMEDHMLMHMPQVVVTPHLAFYSKEAIESILDTTVDNITTYASGTPQNLIK
jgi:D-lactate dehydrogenase